ncbi:MAG: hypothetical protein E6J79_08120 [Deltaproteobacteria bacterium]|nr:MAG: hypothetical protein E6J79_08120 [Deltaproteobacteria bacterium]
MTGRASRTVLPGVVTVALTLRLLHLHAVARLLLDEPPEVGMDRWLSTHIAEAVARGDWLGGWSADYDSAPGYGYLLGALFRLSDRHWLPPLLLQVALGALACLLVYDLGRRLWSPTAGLLASALLALYGPALFYETLLVKFSLLTVTVAALLVCVVRAAERDRARWMLLGGLALGLLVMLRGNAALVAVPCAWWVVRGRPVWAGLRSVALFVAGAALVLGPLAFRDHLAAARGRGTSLWGIHFYIGTNADADGTYMPVPGVREDVVGHVIDARQLAEEAEGRRLTPAEVSWHWFRRGVAAIRANKLAWAALELHKLRLALSGGEDGSFGDDFGDSVDASWVLRLPLVTFGSIVPLALLGLILSLRRRRALLLPWFVVAYLVSLLPFFITGRYRLPVVVPPRARLVRRRTPFTARAGARRDGAHPRGVPLPSECRCARPLDVPGSIRAGRRHRDAGRPGDRGPVTRRRSRARGDGRAGRCRAPRARAAGARRPPAAGRARTPVGAAPSRRRRATHRGPSGCRTGARGSPAGRRSRGWPSTSRPPPPAGRTVPGGPSQTPRCSSRAPGGPARTARPDRGERGRPRRRGWWGARRSAGRCDPPACRPRRRRPGG